MTRCTTHHHACDCREAKFAELEAENKVLLSSDRVKELEAENKRLLGAAKTIWRRSQKMSPLDNTWVQDVLVAALAGE